MTATIRSIQDFLRKQGRERRALGELALQKIEHDLNIDRALMVAAARIVDRLDAAGEFGSEEHDHLWLAAKALDLAQCLEGCLEDWLAADGKSDS